MDQRDISVNLFALFIVIEILKLKYFVNSKISAARIILLLWVWRRNFDNMKNCNLKSPTDGSVQNVAKFAT